MKQKRYTSEFKSQIVLEILKEDKTLNEILGLQESDPFWSEPTMEWTSKRVRSGRNILIDHAL